MDLLYGDATLQCLVDLEAALILHLAVQHFQDLIRAVGFVFLHVQRIQTQFDGANRLHHRLLKAGANGHDLTGSLHLGAQGSLGIYKLIERPLGELYNHIVDCRLKACIGLAGNLVQDLVQGVADGDPGGNLCNGIAGGLGCQSGGTGYTGVYLDDRILKAGGMQGKLTVTAALYLQLLNDVDGSGTEHLVLPVGQRHSRSNYDAVTGVYANRIKVLHGADSDHIALSVPDHLKLNFLPAADALFDQHLGNGGKPQTILCNIPQLLLIRSNSAAGAAQGECRTHDYRITDFLGKIHRILNGLYHLGGNAGLPDLFHRVLERLAILRLMDGFRICTKQLYVVSIQEALRRQLHGQGQTGLSPQGGQDAVRLLNLNDTLYGFQG